MPTSRTLVLTLLGIAVLLGGLMALLLLKQGTNSPVEKTDQSMIEESDTQSSEAPATEVAPPVSQENEEEELPLGTDLNMEFPTLEE